MKMICSNRKAVTLSAWMWVIGGVLIAVIIIVFGTTMMIQFQNNNQKIVSLENYDDFVSRVKLVCSQSTGNIDYYSFSVPDVVRAIYPAEHVNENPPDKVSVNISKLDSAKGKYICMQFFDETYPHCTATRLDCNMTMTYLGSPSMGTSLASTISKLTGKYPSYGYKVVINKTSMGNVNITASRELNV